MFKIFCEGREDKKFITQLLQKLENLSEFKPKYPIKTMGGKSRLLNKDNYSLEIKEVESGKIKKVLFIFDADLSKDDQQHNGLEKSKESIEQLITTLNWNIATDYYIFDKNLDDFIINTLKNKSNFEACEACFKLKKVNPNRKILTCIYQRLYPKKPYDFSHQNFGKLKNKLTKLLN